ncbi:hypothetical protein HWV00_11175 [Moritella sp. 24]|uniref:hypothetical protein n=1 Tax=Moritella sp. 24 TaxID=2746230 RepID=UPI001BA6EE22|nr:hypothetical protein [Moritella sp. 24]QUM76748.1 hypothetical protein HWV00_11175 [Moritella sp. 24]
MLKVLLVVSTIFLIQGCASLGPDLPSAQEMVSPQAGEANLIISTGALETNLSFSTYLILYREDDDSVVDAYINLDYPFKSHFTSHHGQLYYLQLQPGKYCYKFGSGNPYFTITENVTGCTTIDEGSVTYGGEIFITGGYIQVNDQFNRDMERLKIVETSVDKRIFNINK